MDPLVANLQALLNTVEEFPVHKNDLLARAQSMGSEPEILDFLQSIPGNPEFTDEQDVLTRFQQARFVAEEESEQPPETVYDEEA